MASPEVLALDAWKARAWKHLHDVFMGSPIGKFYRWEPRAAEGTVAFEKTAAFEITPRGFSANELSVTVGQTRNKRGDVEREREVITWQVVLNFAQEALTEYFDNELFKVLNLTIPPGVAADGERIPPLYFNVSQIDLTHPPMHGSSTGTLARYTIQVIPGRV
ncbi:MAG: hypothetical protein JKY94_17520 [Rhodobacteraceae bacterium]|nr:hypothetical protein [Paracoccaceae bacterium]